MPAEVRCDVFLVKFDLKFEISDVNYLVKFGGKTFRPARKVPKISGRISGQISGQHFRKLRFKVCVFFRKLCSAEGRC